VAEETFEEKGSLKRREFLRRAAITGAAAAWAAPVIQTVAAGPAYAGSTPADCFHSLNGGCMAACNACSTGTAVEENVDCSNPGSACAQLCCCYCHPGQGGDNPCCNPELCDPSQFECVKSNDGSGQIVSVTYGGAVAGCETLACARTYEAKNA
jgi:hypothetical protein